MKLILIGFLSLASIISAADVPITQDELIRRTQELYDSLVSGDQVPWKRHFADDCMFADEKGRFFDKPKLIADITPLPPGYSGTIKIQNPHGRIIGNTAILSYDADETETIFGQNLKARYHIRPLPPGYSGTIKIQNPHGRIIGNTAILSYDADETETIFGQNLKARYHI